MNVMAQAHKATKFLIKSMSVEGQAQVKVEKLYGRMFAINLKRFHDINKAEQKVKAMQVKEANPFIKMIDDCKARIAQLNAIEHRDGYIVVIGDNIRLPVKEHSNGFTRVENASIFWYEEDARQLAVRVRNGNNEVGQVVKKNDQINWEISEQTKLLESMQEYVNKA